MDDVIVVEDRVDGQCVRHVHLMSNAPTPLSANTLTSPHLSLAGVNGGRWEREAGVWHLRMEYPYRGVLDFDCEGWEKFRRLVVWNLDGCGSVREAISQAEELFWMTFKFRPGYAFVRKLARGAENGMDLDGLVLVEAEWMLERCVAVGGKR